MRLSEYIVMVRGIEVARGERAGKCVFCGVETGCGFVGGWSDTFTDFQRMEDGGVVCEYCYYVLKEKDYRRKSWMVEGEEFWFVKREEIIGHLVREKKVPFFIFLTKQGRKHGWYLGLWRLNFGQERWWMVMEDKLIFVEQEALLKMVELGRKLRGEKVRKEEIMGGHFSVNTVRKVGIEVVREVREFVGNPVWEVVVYAL